MAWTTAKNGYGVTIEIITCYTTVEAMQNDEKAIGHMDSFAPPDGE